MPPPRASGKGPDLASLSQVVRRQDAAAAVAVEVAALAVDAVARSLSSG